MFQAYFTEQWSGIFEILLFVAIAILCQSFMQPFTSLWTIMRIQKKVMPFYILQCILVITIVAISGFLDYDFVQMVVVLSLGSCIYYTLFYFFIRRQSRRFDSSIGGTTVISLFEKAKEGRISFAKLNSLFGLETNWLMGKIEYSRFLFSNINSTSRIKSFGGDKVLEVSHTKGLFGPTVGSQFFMKLVRKYQHISLSYYMYFAQDFDFRKGGKLPGLAGGEIIGGGIKATGTNGWSARFMFLDNGRLCAYMYLPNSNRKFGEMFMLRNAEKDHYKIKRGEWLKVEQIIQMNSIGKNNGVLKVKINDVEFLQLDTITYRSTSKLAVDKVLFSVFFGGGDASYAPLNDSSIMFKDFKINAGYGK
jgi:hypothetical protein